MSEQRKFTRIKLDATALMVAEGERWQVELLDISLRGALFKSMYWENLSVACGVTVVITLAGGGDSVEMHGKVVHINDEHIGVACEHMDVDSISLLRRIVELNVGDSELLQREMVALIESVTEGVAEEDLLPGSE